METGDSSPMDRAKLESETQFEQLKLLFDYTKFHIGLYTTLTAAYIALMTSDYGEKFLVPNEFLVWSAVTMFFLAGLAGGIIVSSCPHFARLDTLMDRKIAPYIDGKGFKGRTWTYIEHTAFWIGLVLAVLSFASANQIEQKC